MNKEIVFKGVDYIWKEILLFLRIEENELKIEENEKSYWDKVNEDLIENMKNKKVEDNIWDFVIPKQESVLQLLNIFLLKKQKLL